VPHQTESSPSAAWGSEWDAVADVVVVGAGAAGLTAAVIAASRGCSVIVLEKAEHPGGTTAKSSGTTWIPDNPLMRKLALPDEREPAIRLMARASYPARYVPNAPQYGLTDHEYRLLAALYDHGRTAIEELLAAEAFPVDEAAAPSFPDYHADLPEDAAPVGRSMRIKLTDGHRPGIDPTGGQILIDAMLAALARRGGEVRTGHRVVHLVKDSDGVIIGVEARRRNTTILVGARRGVIFGTGGFLHDPALASAFLRGPVLGGAAAETATGDFVRIGIEAGAMLGNMAQAWWDQVVVEDVVRNRSTIRDCVYPFGDSMVIVNRFGRRVMNEKMVYNERGQVHHYWDPDRREYPNLLLFMLFDDAVLQDPRPARHRYPVPSPGDSRDHVISAPTWPDLAAAISARLADLADRCGSVTLHESFVDNLQQTIARFNDMARTGVDPEHHRGETPIEKAWATPPRHPDQPNPTMHPFADTGPYHCIILGPGALDTKGGPVVDDRARVIGTDGQPIPRLYGAGNCIASPTGQGYYGPGGTIGPAITFGYLAGADAASAQPYVPVFS
jgi:Succinate dehydrogenase/fumarate reductase, flavoprotein subunit